MRRRFTFPLLMVAAVGLVAAACSSTASSTAKPAAVKSAVPSSQAKGAPIVLGAIGGFTGAGSGSTAEGQPVLEAWQDYTNANGGINGHPVKVIIENDANDPATALSDVQQLVEQDHVLAIINVSDDLASVYQDYVQTAGVPVIGQSSASQFGSSTDFFPTGTTVVPSIYVALAAAKDAGVTKLGLLYCAEIATCAEGVTLIQDVGKPLGVSLVYSAKIDSTAPSYTAPCLAAQSSGAKGLTVGAESTTAVNVAQDCAAQGYKPVIVTESGEVTTSWLSVPAFNNMVGSVQDVPWFDTSLPATKTMHDAIAKYEPSVLTNPNFGEVGIIGWVAGMVFEKAAESAGIGPTSTPAQVVSALNSSIKDTTIGGLAPPLTYTAGTPANVSCGYVVGIHDKHFTEPEGLKTVCMPAS